ncbi:Mu-like prophage major head subunit gpT [Pseudomonas sp. NFPP10]|uniref:Mu-like prophage major head subunit gpT family protein n=1 Tax=unclassified Pseudomonas TaxID=196821 RepID=UPI00088293BB|nr:MULTISPECIES: Mu-like prophage major head subunit gpT family protein [unclassified Pseudomonas]SDA18141.1 Mu-like prophage major head subunit gpT [Pseudomonas sp. NFPP12]SEK99001.1 Mu-like prophage major head subunit gpT [Pseudomonas sp. NFPP10]SFI57684.1 Mu-like prophage major head subunit gpT [Pseudomonas sp. NFPP08]SFM42877.1 Mu-like prophage major head subunit gpT [Pseudomonas sp. NFPP05]SFX31316.1 Mu-like prophage major head subunit gpT [Pseudomonas sp. NFPP09]
MIITPASLAALYTAFKAEFQKAQAATPTDWQRIATLVPSSSASNTYGWLGQFPSFREWIGERVLKNMAAHGYTITNKSYEASVGIPRSAIEDDEVGVYKPLFEEMGRASTTHPDELVFGLLKAGQSEKCYDGQYFFDVDHPVYASNDGTGTAVSVSNFQEGTGPAWYLLDVSRAIKPLIFQKRRDYALKAMTSLDDESVFMRDEYRYGVDARAQVGFGFWQFAYCSKAPLTPDSYGAARAAMKAFKGDGGRPLGVTPGLLVVPSVLEGSARKILKKDADGGNEWAGTAEVLAPSWLD